jgi:Tat protein secretion system quality control protein TatD with DNase activity
VAQEIARLKEIPLETVIETTEQNAKDIYRIS